ncbi:MAG: xanthine dehydrogenase family protein subunit M [Chloroflexi bacterium]|nr:xanthine dehydrogenase family protein subunit M [Chloroflexota bacterium]
MIPAAFDYVRATSLDDALARLAAGSGSAKAIAGGQSILPLMKLRLARPELLVDIGRLGELRGVRRLPDGRVAVGALTTYDEMLRDDTLRQYGLLVDALPNIGDVQVRNRGTIGGSIAHADPASDLPAILLALDAEIVARSARDERVIAATSFFEGPFTSVLEPDELITEVRLPGGRDDVASAYRAFEQPASGYSIAAVAAIVGGHDGTRWNFCSVGVTGVGDHPYRASAVEQAVREGAPFDEAAVHASQGQAVASDIHADREYRIHVASVIVRRALEAAAVRLG